MTRPDVLARLIDQGVIIPDPGQVWIDEKVDIERIASPGTVLFPGCRIIGPRTFIAAGARLGAEGPVTVEDSFIGPGAAVKGGYCGGAVLLARASLGAQAHVREGTILEERAATAHAVGLKQTILFPFVTLGSLINFCDVLMTGGSGSHSHSEVGSSYIHFNFTPHRDKATASLLGDVPGGVMLDRPPIFLGGQGGLVGPRRLAFGTVAAAGTIIRKDELREGRLIVGAAAHAGSVAYQPAQIQGLPRIVVNNLIYIGNLLALRCWYREVRRRFVGPGFPSPLHQGLVQTLQTAIDERIQRLTQLQARLSEASGNAADEDRNTASRLFVQAWPAVADTLATLNGESFQSLPETEAFVGDLEKARKACGNDYIDTIRSLGLETRRCASAWLQNVVDAAVHRALGPMKGFVGRP